MLGRLGRTLLIVAVLLAQQTALAHQYWHASTAGISADAKKTPKGDRLCNLHDLLGTVLGVASGTVQTPAFLALAEPGFAAPKERTARRERKAMSIRIPGRALNDHVIARAVTNAPIEAG